MSKTVTTNGKSIACSWIFEVFNFYVCSFIDHYRKYYVYYSVVDM